MLNRKSTKHSDPFSQFEYYYRTWYSRDGKCQIHQTLDWLTKFLKIVQKYLQQDVEVRKAIVSHKSFMRMSSLLCGFWSRVKICHIHTYEYSLDRYFTVISSSSLSLNHTNIKHKICTSIIYLHSPSHKTQLPIKFHLQPVNID